MSNIADQAILEAQDFLAVHDHLERECNRLEQFARIRPVLLKLNSLANAETEIRNRTAAVRNDLAAVEQELSDIRGKVQPARDLAEKQMADARQRASDYIEKLQAETDAKAREIETSIDGKRAQLAELSAKFDCLKAALA